MGESVERPKNLLRLGFKDDVKEKKGCTPIQFRIQSKK